MVFLKHLPRPIAPSFSEALRIDTRAGSWIFISGQVGGPMPPDEGNRFYADRNGLSGSAHVGRLELVAIAGEHAHVTPRRNRTVVSCENT